jgi:hypothetical protein
MDRNVIESDERDEPNSLYRDYAAAVQKAAATLERYGVESPQFIEADRAATAIWRRIRDILGITDQHLME